MTERRRFTAELKARVTAWQDWLSRAWFHIICRGALLSARYRITFSGKGMLNDEILEGLARHPDFSCYQYSHANNRSLARCFIPPEISHVNYKIDDDDLDEAKSACRDLYRDLFHRIKKQFPVDVFLGSNFGAFDEQELTGGLVDIDIAYYSFHKECMLSPAGGAIFWKRSKSAAHRFRAHEFWLIIN